MIFIKVDNLHTDPYDFAITSSLVLENIVIDVYVGTGVKSREITLGFHPRAVYFYPIRISPSFQNFGFATRDQNAVTSTSYAMTYATEYNECYVTESVAENGFKVGYCSSSSSHTRTNYDDYQYLYIELKQLHER